jgi:hypothetical protein
MEFAMRPATDFTSWNVDPVVDRGNTGTSQMIYFVRTNVLRTRFTPALTFGISVLSAAPFVA